MHVWGVSFQEHADPTDPSILHAEGKVAFFDVTPRNAFHHSWVQALAVV